MEQFIIDDRYLTKKIRKSTFKIKGYEGRHANAFIDNEGCTSFIESMHHNSWALEELNKIHQERLSDIRSWKSKIKSTENSIKKLKECPEGVPLPNSILDLGWMYKIYSKSDLHKGGKAYQNALSCLESDLDYYNEMLKEDSAEDELEIYKKMHKNIGIDPAEYLVAELGYAAIENGYLIYGDSISYEWTDNNCLIQDFDKDTHVKFVRPENKRETAATIAKLNADAAYYNSDPKARFHCPSGFMRRDYSEFLSKCKRYGVDYHPRSSRWFT